MRALVVLGLLLALTGGLIAAGVMPLRLAVTQGVVLRNTNLWIQGRKVSPGEPVELVYVFQVLNDTMFKFFGQFYRKYDVSRDSYAYRIVYDSTKSGEKRVLVVRVRVSYDWDPDNVKEFYCNHWCGQKWKTDTDGWAQNVVVDVTAAIYRARLDKDARTLYLIEKIRDVSYNEFMGSKILVGYIIYEPRILNTIMFNTGHSSDTYEIILFKKTVQQNGQVVWNQEAPRVYRAVLDCSWKGFHYELWPARITWNGEVLYDNLGSEPSTTTVWSPIVTSYPGGGEAPSNSTSVTTTRLTTTPGVTFTTTETFIVNETTTTYTSTSIVTSTVSLGVNIEEDNNMLYGVFMSLVGMGLAVFGLRR